MIHGNILVWNCKGVVNRETQHALIDLVRAKRPSLIFLAETLAQQDIIDSFQGRLGFRGNLCFPQEDGSQGVALLWNADLHVSLRTYSPNHIDADISADVGAPAIWRFTGVYGVAARTERRRTWDLIETLAAEGCNLPWLMVGDFNEILSNEDKSGGVPRAATPMLKFRQTMASCGLIDMGFVGCRFTWSNKFTKERLDRGFQCEQWRRRFPYSRVITLNPSDSDHCPILVEVREEKKNSKRSPKRFRFEEMWHGHYQCMDIIKQNWSRPLTGNALQQLGHKIQYTGERLFEWHSVEFEKQNVELRVVQEKLNDIMKAPYSPTQYEEQRVLHVKLSQLLAQQEKYWRQRSRAMWLKDGDRNSAFFHRKATNRRTRNAIKGLKDSQGEWQIDPVIVQRLLVNYYKNVFTSSGANLEAINEVISATSPMVTMEMNEALLQPYTEDEIRAALFQMHPSKSPGPDGMSPFLFQKYWHIVGTDVCVAIKMFLEKGEAWADSNFTHLCLIPKIQNPTEEAHFRPIALCNVIYRICSKVVANRLKKCLPEIISPLQSAYVPRRLISDNTLVATEAAHFMHKLTTQEEGFFSLKLDISKAYDRLEWSFLYAMLARLGFAGAWIDMIMSCIMSVSYAVLVNGEVTQKILPTRGIRQGDPLSPYLFILCAEGLSALITQSVNQGLLKGLKMCPQAPTLHHLFFADDSILFGAATAIECLQANLLEILEVQCVEEHDRYLGLPLRVGRSKSAIFAYLKEKLSKKLIGWKTKILSSAGKETLIKAVAQTMPLYTMNCYLLPKGLCDEFHQLCASFFWGDTDEKKKIHWRSWERLCLTKQEGGMGFKNLYAYNLAMLAKQGWRIVTNPDSLIAQLYKARYFPHCSFWEAEMGEAPSFSWRSIMNGRQVLQAGVRWRIGDGTSVNIWTDRWLQNGPMLQRPDHTDFRMVADLINSHDRTWIPSTVHSLFSPDIASRILATPLSRRAIHDRLCWSPDKRGHFTVKTAYWIARESVLGNVLTSSSDGDPFNMLWKAIWKAKVPGKVQICIWRAANNLLPTRACLTTKGYTGDTSCVLCNHRLEDVSHVLYKCPIAVELLSSPPLNLQQSLLPHINFKEWLLDCAMHLNLATFEKLMMVLWSVWKNRNSKLWDGVAQTAPHILLYSMAWLEEFHKARDVHHNTGDRSVKQTWKPATEGRIKLNVDGSFIPSMQRGGAGGVIREEKGLFIAAFAHTMPHVASAKQSELFAVREGLDLVRSLNLQNVTLESDCLEAVQLITSEDHDFDEQRDVLDDIAVLVNALPSVEIKHASRTCNNVAHNWLQLLLSQTNLRSGFMYRQALLLMYSSMT
ncbi:uncharacterized protein LOC112203585 [Rosa chinensis]|uniref:uncharacterized protein LOC112203585 n=1 Tax=Rosa chinensis TaxID=74649 RepID=UPI000D091EC5|nr:uncharacterized protein LOC112203585 [Rosa chinensis]